MPRQQPEQVEQRSDQLFNSIATGMASLREELSRECDDITSKIDQIMRTELITFDKLKQTYTSSINLEDE